ncbi:hypothetical protein [Helicobacter suis]|uniref:hypothetical protein n=1 Tax=Helicobacter suis TaxID=104628 RepID=UPI0013D69756|nr:hypothetical protein [Helicobacter suis]
MYIRVCFWEQEVLNNQANAAKKTKEAEDRLRENREKYRVDLMLLKTRQKGASQSLEQKTANSIDSKILATLQNMLSLQRAQVLNAQ